MIKLPRRSPDWAGSESLMRASESPASDRDDSLSKVAYSRDGPEEADVASSDVSAVGYSHTVFPDSSSVHRKRKTKKSQTR